MINCLRLGRVKANYSRRRMVQLQRGVSVCVVGLIG